MLVPLMATAMATAVMEKHIKNGELEFLLPECNTNFLRPVYSLQEVVVTVHD